LGASVCALGIAQFRRRRTRTTPCSSGAMLYRHSVIHAHVHPFVYVAGGGPDDVHLRIDPRLGVNDPPYGPNGNISADSASNELRRILALCRARTAQALAIA